MAKKLKEYFKNDMKEFLENNAYFVDFFNAYFFDGERVLKPENCMELDSEMNDSNMDLEKHVDVIRKYNDGNLYSAFIIENQSYVDMSMVVRAAVYEFVAYERMLKKSKKNRNNKADEITELKNRLPKDIWLAELDEFLEPTIKTRSAFGAISLIATCRFWVA